MCWEYDGDEQAFWEYIKDHDLDLYYDDEPELDDNDDKYLYDRKDFE